MTLEINNPALREIAPKHNGRSRFELLEPLEARLELDNGDFSIIVPKGFKTDFASVPRALWPLFPPTGKHSRAAIVHDFLYASKKCSRFLADAIFREMMQKLGTPWWKRVIMYYAVRLFGAFAKTD